MRYTGRKESVDGDSHSVDDSGGSILPASPNDNRSLTHERRETMINGDTRVLEVTSSNDTRLVIDVSRNTIGWIEITGPYGDVLFCLNSRGVRHLADALAPYQTQRVANDLVAEPVVYQADRFCHTCGTRTVENKPRNDAPTFLAPRHGVYAGEK
jgi:hypothetical protein